MQQKTRTLYVIQTLRTMAQMEIQLADHTEDWDELCQREYAANKYIELANLLVRDLKEANQR